MPYMHSVFLGAVQPAAATGYYLFNAREIIRAGTIMQNKDVKIYQIDYTLEAFHRITPVPYMFSCIRTGGYATNGNQSLFSSAAGDVSLNDMLFYQSTPSLDSDVYRYTYDFRPGLRIPYSGLWYNLMVGTADLSLLDVSTLVINANFNILWDKVYKDERED